MGPCVCAIAQRHFVDGQVSERGREFRIRGKRVTEVPIRLLAAIVRGKGHAHKGLGLQIPRVLLERRLEQSDRARRLPVLYQSSRPLVNRTPRLRKRSRRTHQQQGTSGIHWQHQQRIILLYTRRGPKRTCIMQISIDSLVCAW